MPLLDLTGYRLTFADEFNTRSISQTGQGTTWADIRSQWRYDANSDIGFGHSSFVDPASGYDPFSVQGGALAITAVPDRTKYGYPGSWESGLITTQGNFSQTYGYFEMRADLADAKGGWDAFWLLPNTPAPNPTNLPGWQELDVVEHYGAYNQGTYRWIHTTDPGPNKNPNSDLQVFSNNPTQVTGYHTYGMDWQKDTISFYLDGQFMGSRPTPSDMHGPMYLLANLATQNDADEAGVPMSMKIDYIRAYSNDPNATAIAQQAVSAPDGQDPGIYGATVAFMASPLTASAIVATTSVTSIANLLWHASNGATAVAGITIATQTSWVDQGTIPSVFQPGATGDFNGDGTSDILWHAANGQTALATYQNAIQTVWTDLGLYAPAFQVMGSGDFNGDGTSDVLWRAGNGQTAIATIEDNHQTKWTDLGVYTPAFQFAATGDFNGDGTSDIIWHAANGQTAISTIQNNGQTKWTDLGQYPDAFHFAGVGDFNGDGTTDILWRAGNGNTTISTIKDNAQVKWTDLGNYPGTFEVGRVDDYNGDGTSDIVWHASNGQTAIATIVNNAQNIWIDLGVIPPVFDLFGH